MRKPFVIAEAAQGYEGSAEIALLLVRGAASAGADAVKFQIVFADDVAVPGYRYYDLFRRLEMDIPDWRLVREAARDAGIAFYADVIGPRAVELVDSLGVDGIKIHSTCFFERPLLDWAFAAAKPVLLSIGGIEEGEVLALIARHELVGSKIVTVMHGYQAEPTPIDRNALARIPRLRQIYGLDIGFMDHADGNGADTLSLSAMALALGVTVFEKHITLDRTLQLEDYVSALAPAGFAAYVADLRRLAGALGDGHSELHDEEHSYREMAVKRVVATHALAAGTIVTAADIALKRPIEPAGLFEPELAVGRTLVRAVAAGSPIRAKDLH